MSFGEYSKEQGKELLALARRSIESYFSEVDMDIPKDKVYQQARGVFVTLTKNGKLRGCIGYTNAVYPIGEAVVRAARAAAFEDPRFPHLKEGELEKIVIELSILTTPQPVKDFKEITIGKDGLICSYLGYYGLLLPQVATEHKMNKIEFLEAVCEKAGLPDNSWQNSKTQFMKFQAQIFNEREYK